MRLIEKFKEQLKIDYVLETTQYIGTNISLNDDFKNIVIKDIISIEFSALYPVLLSFYTKKIYSNQISH